VGVNGMDKWIFLANPAGWSRDAARNAIRRQMFLRRSTFAPVNLTHEPARERAKQAWRRWEREDKLRMSGSHPI